jgi:predicted phage terminase large subunit-like protein
LLSEAELAELEYLAERELGLECPPSCRDAPIELREYTEAIWPTIEPTSDLSWNWHLDIFAKKCNQIARKQSRDTIVNIPPGAMKSLWWCVIFPTWVWTWWPESRWMFSSYNGGLSIRDSTKRRRVIESDWYRRQFGVILVDDQNQKVRFENSVGGFMFATSTFGQVTGEHIDYLLNDDPHKADEVYSDAERQAVIDSYESNYTTRGVSRNVTRMVIMQRLHKEDLSGVLKKTGEWDLISLPMRFEPGRDDIHPDDPRTEEGELLWPSLFNEEKVAKLEAALGLSKTAGQLQQRPPDQLTGVEWPQSYWDNIYAAEHHWPDQFQVGVIAVDPSKGKDAKKGDYSGIVFMGLSGGKLWVDANGERRPVEKIISDTIDIALSYAHSLHAVAVEVNGFQELLLPEFERQTQARKIMPLPLFSVENRVKKELRIARLGPYFARGAIVVRKNAGGELLVKQASQFSQSPQSGVHDDLIDAAEMALRVLMHLQGIDVESEAEVAGRLSEI